MDGTFFRKCLNDGLMPFVCVCFAGLFSEHTQYLMTFSADRDGVGLLSRSHSLLLVILHGRAAEETRLLCVCSDLELG